MLNAIFLLLLVYTFFFSTNNAPVENFFFCNEPPAKKNGTHSTEAQKDQRSNLMSPSGEAQLGNT